MYSAYFDESGHPDKGSHLVVAGCIADVGQWVHFDREWKAALAPLGTDVFHMVDFDQRKKPFDALTETQADDLLELLVGIICRRIEKSLAQILRLNEYNAINHKYVFAQCYGFPYPMLGRGSIGQVQTWAEKHAVPESELLYFFENGAKHKGQLEWIAERDKFQIPIFLEKKKHTPLQAGDLLAWCLHLHSTSGGKVHTRYKRALNRLSLVSSDWGIINLKDPDRIPAILNIPPRDHRFKYQFMTIRKDGKRLALTHYKPKGGSGQFKLSRKSLVLPDPEHITFEVFMEAASKYELSKK